MNSLKMALNIYDRRGVRTTVKLRSLTAAIKVVDVMLCMTPTKKVCKAPIVIEIRRDDGGEGTSGGLNRRYWWNGHTRSWNHYTNFTSTEIVLARAMEMIHE